MVRIHPCQQSSYPSQGAPKEDCIKLWSSFFYIIFNNSYIKRKIKIVITINRGMRDSSRRTDMLATNLRIFDFILFE